MVGHLGKSNKPRLEDNEGEEKENDGNYTEEEEDEYELPPFYVKDFFNSLSYNSFNREPERGRLKLSELRRIDIETFGKIPRLGRSRSSWGLSRGGKSRGSGVEGGMGMLGGAVNGLFGVT
ncbi:protein decapping 5-like [Actinidia eriantha]|uniref:protein decapping 5-like n=1 Tax=Actinidia eriantha TaxID=165200 RepID=UPI0025831119|nr:protein decapping 5-like [Actinidia eriantha]